MSKTILVTGAAGFIGANLCLELLKSEESYKIVGLDNMNDSIIMMFLLKSFDLKKSENKQKNLIQNGFLLKEILQIKSLLIVFLNNTSLILL